MHCIAEKLKRQRGAHRGSRLTLRLKVQAASPSDVASSTQHPQTRREQELGIKQDTVEDTKGERDKDEIQGDTPTVQKKWETISEERAEECLREARRRGSKPLNTCRLNIVGEGRAGKTAWLRSVSKKAFEDTTSTIGVRQSLLEVNKVDMETKCEGGWSVVEEGTLIMKEEEAVKRLAAEIAVMEPAMGPGGGARQLPQGVRLEKMYDDGNKLYRESALRGDDLKVQAKVRPLSIGFSKDITV
jgi:hypothetical protein